jgi:hypothetical protein
MEGLISRAHNKSKRRRENKELQKVLRHPKKREELINYLIQGNAIRSPLREMVRSK